MQFCNAFWEAEWLSRYADMLLEWMRCAGGILENITLMPCPWTEMDDVLTLLEVRRYALSEPELEQLLQERRVALHALRALAGNQDDGL